MFRISLIFVLILSSLQVFAAKPMDNAITAMCDNLKKCTIEHLAMKQKVDDKAKALIVQAFDKKCDAMKSHYHDYIEKSLKFMMMLLHVYTSFQQQAVVIY